MKKQYQKELKKERKMLGDVLPILDENATNHQLGSMEELTQLIRDNLLESQEEEPEEFDEYSPTTLVEVPTRAKSEFHDKIIILDSELEKCSAINIQTTHPCLGNHSCLCREVWPILKRSNQNQSTNLQAILRETSAAGVLDISNKESKSTMDAFGEQRRFRYKKRDIELQTHIKIGTAQDRFNLKH